MNEAATTELILYATPTGVLADACERYFAEATALGATTAQTYPPHCTLTGFFRRSPDRISVVADEVREVIGADPAVPDGEVRIVQLLQTDEWIGLELSSPWLEDLTRRFADVHAVKPGEDALRPKDWLHLSLAYGVDDLTPYRSLTDRCGLTSTLTGSWEVALWERHSFSRWHRHT